ncbi:MAG TPA: type II toxin-antitoxin system Phd/YefM family antitoxin [Caulobacteraceae bacterium]|jgi:prevent-host-death family protein
MSMHSVADAKNKLSELIDRAIGGEDVVITRHGTPVAVLKGVASRAQPVTDDEIAWLERHRIPGPVPSEDAGQSVRRMRDDDWA